MSRSNEIQASSEREHSALGSLPPWDRYLHYVERSKIRNEIALSYEDWAREHGVDAVSQGAADAKMEGSI